MTRERDEQFIPVLVNAIVLLSAGITSLLSALVHISAGFLHWAAVTLHLRAERKFDDQLNGKIDPDIERLLQTVRIRAAAATSLSRKTFGDKWGDAVGDIERNGELPATAIMQAYFNAAWKLFEEEAHDIVDLPPSGDVIKRARYLDYLIDRAQRLKDPDALIDAFVRATADSFTQFSRTLSPLAFQPDDAPATFATISLRDAIRNIPAAVDALFIPFIADNVAKLGLFSRYRAHFATLDEKPPIPEDASTDLIDTYFTNTPFANFFTTKVPFTIPTSRLLEHCVIVAGSGMGKTQTLGSLITYHLTQKDPPALVVLDSTGALVGKVQTLALFNQELKDRLLIIDPEHDPVPALNMFDVSSPRMQGYSVSMRESIETEIVALFNYIFTSAQNDLTSRQGTVFSYVVRLVLSIPNATVHTLLDVLEEEPKGGYAASKYRSEIEKLDSTARMFFKNQYYSLKTFREQIAGRLYDLIKLGAFNRMFSATNRVDFYEELQDKGSIILVNTSERTLKGDGSTHFGRYIIARTMAAAFERAAIPEQKRRPTFLIVDEAAPYFDSIFEKLLTRVRQYKLGICLAFQHMEQADDNLKSAIASNTSVKLAGGLGYADSRWLARDMETTPEFIKAQHRDQRDPPQWTHLACYVRNYTPSAVSLTVPFYVLDKMPQMTQEEHRALLAANRERVSALAIAHDAPPPLIQPEPSATVPEPPPKPATTTSSPKSPPAPAHTPKPIVPQPTPNADPDHGEAGEPANKW